MGKDRLDYFALPTARTHLPRNIPCDSVAYAEGVQKRNPFLFLSFSYFSDRRKVPLLIVTFRTGEKYMVLFCYFSDKRKVPFTYSYFTHKVTTVYFPDKLKRIPRGYPFFICFSRHRFVLCHNKQTQKHILGLFSPR